MSNGGFEWTREIVESIACPMTDELDEDVGKRANLADNL
jgi:hypothetical protein